MFLIRSSRPLPVGTPGLNTTNSSPLTTLLYNTPLIQAVPLARKRTLNLVNRRVPSRTGQTRRYAFPLATNSTTRTSVLRPVAARYSPTVLRNAVTVPRVSFDSNNIVPIPTTPFNLDNIVTLPNYSYNPVTVPVVPRGLTLDSSDLQTILLRS